MFYDLFCETLINLINSECQEIARFSNYMYTYNKRIILIVFLEYIIY